MYGTESRIQLNDQFATVGDIQEFIAREREARDEVDRKFLTTSIKADKMTRMGVVTDIKQELRKAGAFKINYSSRKAAAKQR
jgi:biopolymer transport protein ExbD